MQHREGAIFLAVVLGAVLWHRRRRSHAARTTKLSDGFAIVSEPGAACQVVCPPSLRCLLVLDLDHTILARPISDLPELARVEGVEDLSREVAASFLIDAEAVAALQRACAVGGHVMRIGTHASDAVMVGEARPNQGWAGDTLAARVRWSGGNALTT